MQPTFDLLKRIGPLMVADASGLNDPTNLKVHLAQNSFTPSLTLTLGMVVEANFGGYAAKNCTPPAVVYNDPTTGRQVMRVPPPVGGLVWTPNSSTNLPQTIYGAYLTGQNNTNMWGSILFDEPIPLGAPGDLVEMDTPEFLISLGALT